MTMNLIRRAKDFLKSKVYQRAKICKHLVKAKSAKTEDVLLVPDFCPKCRAKEFLLGMMG